MSEIHDLLDKYRRSKEIVEQREGKLHNFVKPVLEVFRQRVGINNVSINGGKVLIEYGWSCRGCYDSDDITLPLWIFESKNPVESANSYKKSLEDSKRAKERQEKLEEIKRLQEELNEEG